MLGPLEVLDASGQPLVVAGAKERAILAALLIHPGEVVSTDRLIDILWPSEAPSNPTNALQARVSALRRSVGEGVIVTQAPGYRLATDPRQVDSGRFEALVGRARASGDNAGSALSLYDEALELWRGVPYADFAYQDFARAEISRLEELWITAREERIQLLLDLGRHNEVLGELEGLILEHPLRERIWGQLMVALYRAGRQADALRAYRQAATVLGDELGIEPSLELRQLEEAVLTQDPTLALAETQKTEPGHNLPARLTPLVGRSDDIRRVLELLDEYRLITVTGPGGVGKTSLAVAVGEEAVARFRHGVWLVELAAVEDPSLVPVEIARDLGLDVGDRLTLDLVCEFLQDRVVALILDNCEHLVDSVAETALAILQRAPRCKIIATSREPVGVTGEILWPTRPLPAPEEPLDPAELVSYDSVRLFVQRARATLPDFVLDATTAPGVADICRRLDGLPLAIELAAARVRNLPVAEISARLDDRFRLLGRESRAVVPRQQTLDAAIAWSYALLSEEEKELFRRVSVFSGGWTLEAAEAITPDPGSAFHLLGRLVDRSLVVADPSGSTTRYTMLETIRAFAARELAASADKADVVGRHAHWFLELAESGEPRGPDQSEWVRALSADHENLRAAIGQALDHGKEETSLRLAGALGWWWFFGNRDEGRSVLDQLLDATADRPGPTRVSALQARALLDLFGPTSRSRVVAREALEMARALDDPAAAALAKVFVALDGVFGSTGAHSLRLLEESAATFRQLGNVWGEGFAVFQKMEVVSHGGDLRSAIEEGEAALALFRRTQDPWAISGVLAHLGRYRRLTGDLTLAEDIAGQARDVAASRGLPHTVQYVMTDQAYLRSLIGDAAGALQLFGEALSIAVDVGNQVGVATIRNGMAESHLLSGSIDEARHLHRQAVTGFEELHLATDLAYSLARLALVEECAGQWDEAERLHSEALAAARRSGDMIQLTRCLEGLARVGAARNDLERAARFLAAGSALRNRSGLAPTPVEMSATEAAEKKAANRLDPGIMQKITAEIAAMEPTELTQIEV